MDFSKFYQTTTKEQLFIIAYNFAMLQAAEDEAEALELLKEEKKLIK